MLRFSHPKETQNEEGAKDVRKDEDVFAVVTVCYHSGDRTDEEGSQHTHHEEATHGEPRLSEFRDQCSGGNEVEPVTQQADDLAKPEVAKISIAANQLAIAYR